MDQREKVVRLVIVGLGVPFLACCLLLTDANTARYHPMPTPRAPQSTVPCARCGQDFEIEVGSGRGSSALLEWEEVQRRRRAAVVRGCSHHTKAAGMPLFKKVPSRRRLTNILVDDRHKLLYCYVPKVACTNWKRMMMILSGRTNHTDPMAIKSHVPHIMGILPSLSTSKMSRSMLNRKLRTYTKVMFVRSPEERLVSAYRNKLVINSTSADYFKRVYGTAMLQHAHKSEPSRNVTKSGNGVTFPEFVSYLVDRRMDSLQPLNEHWAPYVDLCHPCAIKYDVIGKYETLEDDAEFLLRKIHAPSELHFPTVVPSRTTGTLVDAHLRQLPPRLLQKLYDTYKVDHELYQYQFRNQSKTS